MLQTALTISIFHLCTYPQMSLITFPPHPVPSRETIVLLFLPKGKKGEWLTDEAISWGEQFFLEQVCPCRLRACAFHLETTQATLCPNILA